MQLALSTGESARAQACPSGGFFCILGDQILVLIWLLKKNLLSTVAIRVYISLVEMRGERFVRWLEIRRERAAWNKTKEGPCPRPLEAHYAILPELMRHTGLPRRKLMHALSELERLGLVQVSRERITFATRTDSMPGIDFDEFDAWAKSYQAHRNRLVPLGRRMLRFLASGAGGAKNFPVFFGVVMGILLRGAFYYAHSENPYRCAGWVRLDWLAELVGVSERTIQRVKERLRLLGWVVPQEVSQWARNRYGDRFEINPTWALDVAVTGQVPIPSEPKTSPAPPAEAPNLTPEEGEAPPQLSPPGTGCSVLTVVPCSDNESPNGTKNQDNESHTERCDMNACPDDFRSHVQEKKNQAVAELPAPRLSDINPELDLVATGMARLMILYAQALAANLLKDCEASRLYWVAAAVRAMTQPNVRNRGGLFLTLVKMKLWSHLSDRDFEVARRRLRTHFFSDPPKLTGIVLPFPSRAVVGSENPPARPGLSADAITLQLVRNRLRLRNENLEPAFGVLRQAGFDRARYVAARDELVTSGR